MTEIFRLYNTNILEEVVFAHIYFYCVLKNETLKSLNEIFIIFSLFCLKPDNITSSCEHSHHLHRNSAELDTLYFGMSLAQMSHCWYFVETVGKR